MCDEIVQFLFGMFEIKAGEEVKISTMNGDIEELIIEIICLLDENH